MRHDQSNNFEVPFLSDLKPDDKFCFLYDEYILLSLKSSIFNHAAVMELDKYDSDPIDFFDHIVYLDLLSVAVKIS